MYKVRGVDYEPYYSKGYCDTCDYGANYIDDITIRYDDDEYITFHSETGYEILSESDWMVMLANCHTREGLIEAWKDKVKSYTPSESIYYTTGLTFSNESTVHYLNK